MGEEKKCPPTEEEQFGLFFLWHLEAIQWLYAVDLYRNPPPVVSAEETTACSTVAIIDNGAVADHPNLKEHRMPQRIDFANSIYGAVYPGPCDLDDFLQEGPGSTLKEKTTDYADVHEKLVAAWCDLVGASDEKSGLPIGPLPPAFPPGINMPLPLPYVEDPSARFSAHGTACAGLVGADWSETNDNPYVLPYLGVDRRAKIIPINTVYSHEYWTLIVALLYAQAAGADVILLPRAMEDMKDPSHCDEEPLARDDPRFTRFKTDAVRYEAKLLFERVLREVSEHIPVVVAAGNEGRGPLSYPARLAVAEHEGESAPVPHLIVVGAATAFGTVASYCAGRRQPNDAFSDDILIYAPSDDREMITDEIYRVDDFKWRGRKLPPAVAHLPKAGANDYCPYKVLAIDIPGPYGYGRESNDVEDILEPGSRKMGKAECDEDQSKYLQNQPKSLYTLFGGTSAAASIVAGTISLMQREAMSGSKGYRLPVAEIRYLLESEAQPFQDMRKPLRERDVGPARFLDVRKLLKRISDGASR